LAPQKQTPATGKSRQWILQYINPTCTQLQKSNQTQNWFSTLVLSCSAKVVGEPPPGPQTSNHYVGLLYSNSFFWVLINVMPADLQQLFLLGRVYASPNTRFHTHRSLCR
jgi:hypothetical protein